MARRWSIGVLSGLLLFFLLLSGCQNLVKGSGDIQTKGFDFTDFANIEIDGPFTAEITSADTYSIRITADDNVFEKMEITRQDNTLTIRLKRVRFFGLLRAQYVDTKMMVVISVPQLRGLKLSGGAAGYVADCTVTRAFV